MAGHEADLSLEVATPTGLALRVRTGSVQAPSVEGEFGVLPGHVPLLAALKIGVLKYRVDGKDLLAAVGQGFVEAGPDKVLMLTDSFVKPADVEDPGSLRERIAKGEAELVRRFAEQGTPEYDELVRDVDWLRAQLEIVAS